MCVSTCFGGQLARAAAWRRTGFPVKFASGQLCWRSKRNADGPFWVVLTKMALPALCSWTRGRAPALAPPVAAPALIMSTVTAATRSARHRCQPCRADWLDVCIRHARDTLQERSDATRHRGGRRSQGVTRHGSRLLPGYHSRCSLRARLLAYSDRHSHNPLHTVLL